MEHIHLAFDYVVGLITDLIIRLSGWQPEPRLKDDIAVAVKTAGAIGTVYGAVKFIRIFRHKRTGWPRVVAELSLAQCAFDVFSHFAEVQIAMRTAVNMSVHEKAKNGKIGPENGPCAAQRSASTNRCKRNFRF